MVLDIGLPGMDGFEVLDQLRSQGSRMPVIVLTARDSVTDTVDGARQRRRRLHGQAVPVRRADGPRPAAAAHGRRRRRPTRTRRSCTSPASCSTAAPAGCRSAASVLDLSAREFALAEIFMLNPGQVLTREQLLDHVWGYDFDPGSNVVDVYVGYLRKKVGSDAIETVRGVGYRFRPADLRRRGVAGTGQPRTLKPARLPRGWRSSTGASASTTSYGAGRAAGSRWSIAPMHLDDLVRHSVRATVAGSAASCGSRSARACSARGRGSSKARSSGDRLEDGRAESPDVAGVRRRGLARVALLGRHVGVRTDRGAADRRASSSGRATDRSISRAGAPMMMLLGLMSRCVQPMWRR